MDNFFFWFGVRLFGLREEGIVWFSDEGGFLLVRIFLLRLCLEIYRLGNKVFWRCYNLGSRFCEGFGCWVIGEVFSCSIYKRMREVVLGGGRRCIIM